MQGQEIIPWSKDRKIKTGIIQNNFQKCKLQPCPESFSCVLLKLVLNTCQLYTFICVWETVIKEVISCYENIYPLTPECVFAHVRPFCSCSTRPTPVIFSFFTGCPLKCMCIPLQLAMLLELSSLLSTPNCLIRNKHLLEHSATLIYY